MLARNDSTSSLENIISGVIYSQNKKKRILFYRESVRTNLCLAIQNTETSPLLLISTVEGVKKRRSTDGIIILLGLLCTRRARVAASQKNARPTGCVFISLGR